MKFFSIVENLILKLSIIPGLGFLHGYVREFYSRQADIQAGVGRYQGYVGMVRGAGAEVAQAARGSDGKSESSDEDEEASSDELEETYDDESFMQ